MPGPNLQLKPVRSTLWAEVSRLAFVIGLEQRILMLIVSYALAIALFSLVVPLTVQELVNSFAISIQPVMIVTLALIILIGLLFIGFFRVFQTSATHSRWLSPLFALHSLLMHRSKQPIRSQSPAQAVPGFRRCHLRWSVPTR